MKKRLSYSLLRTLKPKEKPYQITDSELPAFKVRVQPTGAIIYQLRIGRSSTETLGHYPDLTPDEARKLAEKRIPEVRKQPQIRGRVPTFEGFVEGDYREHVEANHNAAAKNLYRLRAMVPTFGKDRLTRIDERAVEKYRRDRLAAGKSAKTVDNDITEIRTMLNKAVEWRIIPENPIARIKLMRPDNRRVKYLSRDHEVRLRAALTKSPVYLNAMAVTTMNTGLRFGELANLEWIDIDLTERMLTVRPRGQRSGKRGGKMRYVPLNEEAQGVFWGWRGSKRTSGTLVFPGRYGEPFDNIQKSWRTTLKRVNDQIAEDNQNRDPDTDALPYLDDFRWHDLRHHFASRLVQAGVDLYAVQKLLGHQSYQMVQRYAHLAPKQLSDAVARLVH